MLRLFLISKTAQERVLKATWKLLFICSEIKRAIGLIRQGPIRIINIRDVRGPSHGIKSDRPWNHTCFWFCSWAQLFKLFCHYCKPFWIISDLLAQKEQFFPRALQTLPSYKKTQSKLLFWRKTLARQPILSCYGDIVSCRLWSSWLMASANWFSPTA